MIAKKGSRMYAYGFTLLELMIIMAILSLLATIAIPNFISYRDKAYCNRAETDARNVASEVTSYFGVPSHNTLPKLADLKVNVDPANSISILGEPNTTISVVVVDKSKRCPKDYMDANPQWDSKTRSFTKFIK